MHRFWQYVSPSTLFFALLLFPLPWVEIQCKDNGTKAKVVPGTSVQFPAWADQGEREVLYTQSGWQAIHGSWSPANPEEFWKKSDSAKLARDIDELMPTAPTLSLFPVLLLAAIVAGLALPLGPWRRAAVVLFASGAVAVSGTHWFMDYPLKHAYCQLAIRDAAAKERIADPTAAHAKITVEISPGVTLRTDPTPAEVEMAVQECTRYTGWFWLAHYAIAISLAMLAIEWWCLRCRRAAAQSARSAGPAPPVPALSAAVD